ncbi:MAG TPA: tetratricopeptide repeat protein [Treponemataceae bacterium]|nr:tetratricopeptide repeat protein [Treponemataceae bacterium]
MKKPAIALVLLLAAVTAFAQDPLMAGLDAYAKSDWSTATLSFRRAVTNPGAGAEPWYWLIMSELASGDIKTALSDIQRFTVSFPDDERIPDITYQEGRVHFLMGSHEDSIQTLYRFVSQWPSHDMVPSAYYWIGENLYSVGRFEEARSVFSLVLTSWPQGIKREAASYRISLIKQTAKEDELLKLLKMSHEESLRIIEDYQRRERTYEQAITAYQKRISDMIKDTRMGELEQQLGEEKTRNAQLMDRISELELRNAELAAGLVSGADIPASSGTANTDLSSEDPDSRRRALEELRNKARSLQTLYDQILEGEAQ